VFPPWGIKLKLYLSANLTIFATSKVELGKATPKEIFENRPLQSSLYFLFNSLSSSYVINLQIELSFF